MREFTIAALSIITLTARSGQQSSTFVTSTEGVRVDALVMDGRRPISGLAASDFEIRDDGVIQQVTLVATEATPIDVQLVLDGSDSLPPQAFQQLREVATRLGTALRPIDRVGLTTFTHIVRRRQPLTNDVASFRRALELEAPSSSGGTALFDAVLSAIALSETGPRRSLIIILSDGEDTASWLKPDSVLAAARKSEVVVYSILTEGSAPKIKDTRPGADFPAELSEATGGRVFTGSAATIARRFADVVAEFQNRYVLTFVPSVTSKPGWHALDVRAAKGTVIARRGYFSGGK